MGGLIEYYSKKDVQKAIVDIAKNREVAVNFGDKGFGKRPDILQFYNDVEELAKQGATSFNISEEHWKNPLLLKPGMTKQQLDELRLGWDLCLPDYERIFIIKNGKFEIRSIKEILESIGIKNKVGKFRINNLRTISINSKNFRLEEDRIEDIFIRKKRKSEKLFKIKVEDGREIFVSQNHPIIIFEKNGILVKKAKDITNKDYLIIPLNLSIKNTTKNINLLNMIRSNPPHYQYKLKYKNTYISPINVLDEDEYNRLPKGLKNFITNKAVPVNLYKNLNRVKNNLYIRFRRSRFKIHSVIKLTESFGRLVGYYLSEGSPDDGRLEFTLNSKETEEANDIINIVKSIFNRHDNKHTYKIYKKSNKLKVRINSKLLEILFVDILNLGNNARNKKIPTWIYNAPLEFLEGLIFSYFNGDAHGRYEWNKKSIRIEAFSKSKSLIEGIGILLLRLGIHYNISKRKDGNIIHISGEEGIKNFIKYCGKFTQKRNLVPVKKIIEHPSKHTRYPPFLDEDKLNINFIQNRILLDNLRRAINLNQRLNKKMALIAPSEILNKIINSKLFPIKVISIEEIKYNGFLYNLETEKNHNFLQGDGIFTHNCLDVDGLNLDYSKLVAYFIIEALKFYDINHYSIKFSGNRGFHIGIPFEAFPASINNQETKLLFPDAARIIASYLKEMIKEPLTNKILEKETIQEISNKINKERDFFVRNNLLDVFKLVDIDNIAISSRHMFRSPYSYHEKSGLISIPIKENEILNFDKEKAKIENVKVSLKFLDASNVINQEASQLMTQVFYWYSKNKKEEEIKIERKDFSVPSRAVKSVYFPPCISVGLKGLEDGKKRFLFLLLNFLKNTGYNEDEIKNIVADWNKRNKEPLRENYIQSQLTWSKKQRLILPQNCPKDKDNLANNFNNYYVDLHICNPDNLCRMIRNPVQYAIKKAKAYKNK